MKSSNGERRNCSDESPDHKWANLCVGKAIADGIMKTKHLAE